MLLVFSIPFFAFLLCIAIFPSLPPRHARWWDRNRNKLLVSVLLSLVVLAYYGLRSSGITYGIGAEAVTSAPGFPAVREIIHHAIFEDYVPFIVLLFCLYTVAGGIRVTEDIPAHALTNTVILAIGAVLANVIGTTGASMLLIRPLLQINSERTRTAHTVIFFIFIVSNVGGSLTPIGPPLFLGYLHGVPFSWTFIHLWRAWLMAVAILLAVYFVWDHFFCYPREPKAAIVADETIHVPFRIDGIRNLLLLGVIVLLVATVVPGHPFLGTGLIPPMWLREAGILICAGVGYSLTPRAVREANGFSFSAIAEVAALFLGIFVTMTVPMEYVRQAGSALGISHPAEYFWATGVLSGVLDNAPTYLVFLTAAQSTSMAGPTNAASMLVLPDGAVLTSLLAAVSLGAAFMGALTYIGNGPNFMVKKIAEEAGVKMPGFFRFVLYSVCVLVPLFVVITLIFFRGV